MTAKSGTLKDNNIGVEMSHELNAERKINKWMDGRRKGKGIGRENKTISGEQCMNAKGGS